MGKFADVEGTGPPLSDKLKLAGVGSTEKLLNEGASKCGRSRIAGESGIARNDSCGSSITPTGCASRASAVSTLNSWKRWAAVLPQDSPAGALSTYTPRWKGRTRKGASSEISPLPRK